MNTQAVQGLANAYATIFDDQAKAYDLVEWEAHGICDFVGAAEAAGNASAYRVAAGAFRSFTDLNTSGPGVELAHSPTCEVPLGPGDGLDMSTADLHDDWKGAVA